MNRRWLIARLTGALEAPEFNEEQREELEAYITELVMRSVDRKASQ